MKRATTSRSQTPDAHSLPRLRSSWHLARARRPAARSPHRVRRHRSCGFRWPRSAGRSPPPRRWPGLALAVQRRARMDRRAEEPFDIGAVPEEQGGVRSLVDLTARERVGFAGSNPAPWITPSRRTTGPGETGSVEGVPPVFTEPDVEGQTIFTGPFIAAVELRPGVELLAPDSNPGLEPWRTSTTLNARRVLSRGQPKSRI
jgi:hypothetical protein